MASALAHPLCATDGAEAPLSPQVPSFSSLHLVSSPLACILSLSLLLNGE